MKRVTVLTLVSWLPIEEDSFVGETVGKRRMAVPQGGIDDGETPEKACRELEEEVGLYRSR